MFVTRRTWFDVLDIHFLELFDPLQDAVDLRAHGLDAARIERNAREMGDAPDIGGVDGHGKLLEGKVLPRYSRPAF
jgi:hypothetical protein